MPDPVISEVLKPITFRPLSSSDFPLLRQWLTAAHVRAWWPSEPSTLAEIEQEYGPYLDETSATRAFIFNVGDEPMGMAQCYRHADYPEWDRLVDIASAAGIDYLVGAADRCGQGLGSVAIAAFTAVVFDLYPDVATIVSVPQKGNQASCRALAKAGFTMLREQELASDDPSDMGISAVYVFPRSRLTLSLP